MRRLKVKGVGRASQSPDLIVIHFELKSSDYNYDKALRDLNARTVILRQDIEKAGFSKNDLKTTNYSINTDYRYEKGEKIFLGYIAKHNMKLEFDYDMTKLNQLIQTISDSVADPEYNIKFEIKDKRAFKDKILTDAVKQAKQNASVIADASNIKLGRIIEITYQFNEIQVIQSNLLVEKSLAANQSLDIVPEDIEGSDSVLIEYEIEDKF